MFRVWGGGGQISSPRIRRTIRTGRGEAEAVGACECSSSAVSNTAWWRFKTSMGTLTIAEKRCRPRKRCIVSKAQNMSVCVGIGFTGCYVALKDRIRFKPDAATVDFRSAIDVPASAARTDGRRYAADGCHDRRAAVSRHPGQHQVSALSSAGQFKVARPNKYRDWKNDLINFITVELFFTLTSFKTGPFTITRPVSFILMLAVKEVTSISGARATQCCEAARFLCLQVVTAIHFESGTITWIVCLIILLVG